MQHSGACAQVVRSLNLFLHQPCLSLKTASNLLGLQLRSSQERHLGPHNPTNTPVLASTISSDNCLHFYFIHCALHIRQHPTLSLPLQLVRNSHPGHSFADWHNRYRCMQCLHNRFASRHTLRHVCHNLPHLLAAPRPANPQEADSEQRFAGLADTDGRVEPKSEADVAVCAGWMRRRVNVGWVRWDEDGWERRDVLEWRCRLVWRWWEGVLVAMKFNAMQKTNFNYPPSKNNLNSNFPSKNPKFKYIQTSNAPRLKPPQTPNVLPKAASKAASPTPLSNAPVLHLNHPARRNLRSDTCLWQRAQPDPEIASDTAATPADGTNPISPDVSSRDASPASKATETGVGFCIG